MEPNNSSTRNKYFSLFRYNFHLIFIAALGISFYFSVEYLSLYFRNLSKISKPVESKLNHNGSQNWVFDIQRNRRKIYSQFGQDGVIEYIFKNIGETNRNFVEFGFGHIPDETVTEFNGTNTYRLKLLGWKGWYFDAVAGRPDLGIFKELLEENTIVSVFKRYGVPTEVDFLSVDVDSIDLWLLRALLLTENGYRPRAICVEYNANFPYDAKIACDKTWKPWVGDVVYGASAGALIYIANKFKYDPVFIEGISDIFFIRRDVLNKAGGVSLGLEEMKKQFPLPRKVHKIFESSELDRFVEVETMERTSNASKARKSAQKHISVLKSYHKNREKPYDIQKLLDSLNENK